MSQYYLVDTNVLIDNLDILHNYNIVITSHVIRELEKHKSGRDGALAFLARRATDYLETHEDKIKYDLKDYKCTLSSDFDDSYVDNKLLQAIYDNGYGVITYDKLLKQKCKWLQKEMNVDIDIVNLDTRTVDNGYLGIKDIYLDKNNTEHQQILADLYEVPEYNSQKLATNEYLVIWDLTKPTYNEDGKHTGYEPLEKPFKWDGNKLTRLKYKNLSSGFLSETVKPINVKQEAMFDMLQNKDITVKSAFGKFGVGKDFCMISHAMALLDKSPSHGGFEKIVWVRNNIELKDTEPIGFLPGDKIEKLIEFAMPLADHVGGLEGLRFLLMQGKIEIQHLGTLRGRDIKNSLIYVTEVQNNTTEHVQLLLGRVGKGSQLWLNGDLKQSDRNKFARNSGLQALKILRDQKLYGQVTLDKIERSDTASLAELLE
jgi:predicted ribonuclease YlaK